MAETPDTGGEEVPDVAEHEVDNEAVLHSLLNVAEAVNALHISYGRGPIQMFSSTGPETHNKQLWQDGQLVAAALPQE